MPLIQGQEKAQQGATNGIPAKAITTAISTYKTPSDAKALTDSLHKVNVSPLWAQMARLNPELPNPTCRPFKWDYETIRPYLLEAGRLITEKQAERRVLMLVNPERRKSHSIVGPSKRSDCPCQTHSPGPRQKSDRAAPNRSTLHHRHPLRGPPMRDAQRNRAGAPPQRLRRALHH